MGLVKSVIALILLFAFFGSLGALFVAGASWIVSETFLLSPHWIISAACILAVSLGGMNVFVTVFPKNS